MKIQLALEGLMSVLSQMSNGYGCDGSKYFSEDCFFPLFDIFSKTSKYILIDPKFANYGSASFFCFVLKLLDPEMRILCQEGNIILRCSSC